MYKEIVISRLMGIGDIIMLTPLLRGLKEMFPDTRLILVTKKPAIPVAKRMPFVDEVLAFDKNIKTSFYFVRHLFRKDLAYCVDTSYRVSLIYALAMIRNRVGFPHKRGIYLTKFLKYEPWMDREWEPYVHAMLFKQATGIDVTKLPDWNEFYYPSANAEEIACVTRAFEDLGGRFDNQYTAVSLESDTWQKDWSIDNWIELFNRLSNQKFVVLGAKSTKLSDIKFPDNVIDMRGKTSLIEMGYLIQKASLLVAVCSLFVHVAYAMKTPVIGIYGPQPVWRGAPLNIFASIVSEAKCAPCDMLIHGRGHCQSPYCMDSITVDKVCAAINQFYDQKTKISSTNCNSV